MKLKIRNNKYTRFYCVSALLVACSFAAIAEEISGTVFDKDGEPMIGATVMVEGTKKPWWLISMENSLSTQTPVNP